MAHGPVSFSIFFCFFAKVGGGDPLLKGEDCSGKVVPTNPEGGAH